MQAKGLPQKTVLDELKKIRRLNHRYTDGRILCSMCTKPIPIAEKAYRLFFESNLGDSGLFSGAAELEREVIRELASLLHGVEAKGFLVSGGTEANLLALLVAKELAKVEKPEVILSESAHFSFTKICRLLNIKPVYASLDNSFKVKIRDVDRLINNKTIALVGTAGTAELGAIDPIDGLCEMALKHDVYFHVDAAFGGLVIPFLKEQETKFDFSLEGVKSITVDPHKMGMAAIPAGGILFKQPEMLMCLQTETPYLTDKLQYSFVGTRTGASAASVWAVFKNLGMEGYSKIVGDCMKNTMILAEGLTEAGFELVMQPTLNIVAFRSQNTQTLAKKLIENGWFVSYVPRYDCIRIVVMPHTKKRHTEAFLFDLRRVEKL